MHSNKVAGAHWMLKSEITKVLAQTRHEFNSFEKRWQIWATVPSNFSESAGRQTQLSGLAWVTLNNYLPSLHECHSNADFNKNDFMWFTERTERNSISFTSEKIAFFI